MGGKNIHPHCLYYFNYLERNARLTLIPAKQNVTNIFWNVCQAGVALGWMRDSVVIMIFSGEISF